MADVIPQEAREALNIKPGERLDWEIKQGCLVVYPVPDDPVRAARGMFKGSRLTEKLLEDRRRDREQEERRLPNRRKS